MEDNVEIYTSKELDKEWSEYVQPNAISFQNKDYIFLDDYLYVIDEYKHVQKLIEGKNATGTIWNNELYWTIWSDNNELAIIKITEQGSSSLMATLKNITSKVEFIDIYDNILYLKFANGFVDAYHILDNSFLSSKISDLEMTLYTNENKKAMAIKEGSGTLDYLTYVIKAGFSLSVYDKEFMTKEGLFNLNYQKELFILDEINKGEESTGVFKYYHELIVFDNKLIFYADLGMRNVKFYNIDTGGVGTLVKFSTGYFRFLSVEENYLYGIFKNSQLDKFYLSRINLINLEFNTCFEIDNEQEYLVLNQRVYYIDPISDMLICKELY